MQYMGCLIEYEEILLGKRQEFSSLYVQKGAKPEIVAGLLRYAFNNLLGWTPEEVKNYATMEMVGKLRLGNAVKKLSFPAELSMGREKNMFYLVSLMYPEKYGMIKRDIILAAYKAVLSGELPKIPKNFFFKADSQLYTAICLQYAISMNITVRSIKELYAKFADNAWAWNFLKKARLDVPCRDMYRYPVEMLHDALDEEQKNDLYYHYYLFKASLDKAVRIKEGYHAGNRAQKVH